MRNYFRQSALGIVCPSKSGHNIILKIQYSLIIISILTGALIAQDTSYNHISPRYDHIKMPDQGFQWIDNENAIDSCMAPDDSLWEVQAGDKFAQILESFISE